MAGVNDSGGFGGGGGGSSFWDEHDDLNAKPLSTNGPVLATGRDPSGSGALLGSTNGPVLATGHDPSGSGALLGSSNGPSGASPSDDGSAQGATGDPNLAPTDHLGTAGDPNAQASQGPQNDWRTSAVQGGQDTLLGFDSSKLNDPSYHSDKYTDQAKLFFQGLENNVGLSRGGLGNMVSFLQQHGYGNAKAVGDDKIDYGDGRGPIDVIGSDGSIRFQNTFDNGQWESQHPQDAALHKAGLDVNPGGGGPNPPSGGFGGGGGGFGGYGGFGGGGGYGGGPLPQFADFSYGNPYNPQAISGPDAWQGMSVTSPEALHAQQVSGANAFTAPSQAEAANDPGYQFTLNQGLGALQNAAASKGLLRSGGSLKGLQDYAQQAASTQYDKVYGRKFGEYTTGLADRLNVANSNNAANAQAYGLTNQYQQAAQGQNAQNSLAAWQAYQGLRQQTNQFNAARTDTAAQNNFGNSLAAWQANTNAKLGLGNLNLGYTQAGNSYALGQGQLALGNRQADQSYDLGLRNNALGYTQAGNSFALGQGQLGLGWANYGLGADQQNFNQGYSLADMGLRAAGQYGNYAGNYGANAGNYITGAGNAGAAGQVGSANAWAGWPAGAANGMYGAYALAHPPQYQYPQGGMPRYPGGMANPPAWAGGGSEELPPGAWA